VRQGKWTANAPLVAAAIRRIIAKHRIDLVYVNGPRVLPSAIGVGCPRRGALTCCGNPMIRNVASMPRSLREINGMPDDQQAPFGGSKHSVVGREFGTFGIAYQPSFPHNCSRDCLSCLPSGFAACG
jgi:hypothetical protein